MAAILNSAILNLAILDSASVLWNSNTLFSSLRFTQKYSPSTLTLTQTNSNWLKLIHSQLNLMMAAILNSAILISDTALNLGFRHLVIFSLRFTQKHSSFSLTLTQTNSLWLKLIHSQDWWFPSWILHLGFSFCIVEFRHLVFFSQIHSKTLSLYSDSDSN